MPNIYDRLYSTYYASYSGKVTETYTDFADMAEDARRLLLSGGGTELDRADALGNILDVWGVTMFAAGVQFGMHLVTDMGFLDKITPLSAAR